MNEQSKTDIAKALNEREDIWTALTRAKCRGILVNNTSYECFYDMNIAITAWQPMYDYDMNNSWRALPEDLFKKWVEQELIIKDEGYEVEKALGIVRCDVSLYTITEKGLKQYKKWRNQGKKYL